MMNLERYETVLRTTPICLKDQVFAETHVKDQVYIQTINTFPIFHRPFRLYRYAVDKATYLTPLT